MSVVLTADHGGLDIPERRASRRGRRRAGRSGARRRTMGETLGRRSCASPARSLFGDGAFGDIYIDRALAAAQRARVLREAVAAYRAPSAGRRRLHPRRDRGGAAALRPARRLDA